MRIFSSLLCLEPGGKILCLTNLFLLAYLSRHFSPAKVGVFALAQTMALILTNGFDAGIKKIGSRLVATHPAQVRFLISQVQRRRFFVLLVSAAAAFSYGAFGPVPQDSRLMICLFVLSVMSSVLSLDWLAAARKAFQWTAVWRWLTTFSSLAVSFYCLMRLNYDVDIIPEIAFLFSILAAGILWLLWWRPSSAVIARQQLFTLKVKEQLRWKSCARETLSFLCLLTPRVLGLLLLASQRNSEELGLYAGAYQLILAIPAAATLLAWLFFPALTDKLRANESQKNRSLAIWLLSRCGLLLGTFTAISSSYLVTQLYGPHFSRAVSILRILSLAIPLDMLGSYLIRAAANRSLRRQLLIATTGAIAGNGCVVFFFLPDGRALSAAWATDFSYLVLVGLLFFQMPREQSDSQEPETQLPLLKQAN